jgi:hypothetical protein
VGPLVVDVALLLNVLGQVGVLGLHHGDVADQGLVGEVDCDVGSLERTTSPLALTSLISAEVGSVSTVTRE